VLEALAGDLGDQPVGDGHDGQREGGADGQVEVAGHPQRVVDEVVDVHAGVDHPREAAGREHQARQGTPREGRPVPGQRPEPPQVAVAAALAVAGVLNPLFAAVAMATSSLLVVGNSTRGLLDGEAAVDPDDRAEASAA